MKRCVTAPAAFTDPVIVRATNGCSAPELRWKRYSPTGSGVRQSLRADSLGP